MNRQTTEAIFGSVQNNDLYFCRRSPYWCNPSEQAKVKLCHLPKLPSLSLSLLLQERIQAASMEYSRCINALKQAIDKKHLQNTIATATKAAVEPTKALPLSLALGSDGAHNLNYSETVQNIFCCSGRLWSCMKFMRKWKWNLHIQMGGDQS